MPAGVLRAIAAVSVIGLAYVLSRGSGSQDVGGETRVIAFDRSFPSPLLRAAAPLGDGFEVPVKMGVAVGSGIVTAANSNEGAIVLLHKIRDESGELQYFESSYRGVQGLFVTVGDPVARAQKLAESARHQALISLLSPDSGEKLEISIEKFLRNRPFLASPKYSIPPFSPHGGSPLPIISQPLVLPEAPQTLESP